MLLNTFKVTPIRLFDLALPVLLIIRKVSRVNSAIFIKILSLPMLLILEPISDIKLTLHIIILPFALFKALKEIPLVAL